MSQLKGDDALVAFFRSHAVQNEAKSTTEGRPVYDDIEVCEIRAPGSRNSAVFPATEMSHWDIDPLTGGQRRITYAERFARQYRQFKEQTTQTKAGTPLAYVPFLTEARRAELRALNVYTAEQLAVIDGQELKNLGPNGRTLKNAAQEFLAEAKRAAPNSVMMAELEAMRARNATLEEDLDRAKKAMAEATADHSFDDMSEDQLRSLITANTGHAPQGNLNRKTLVRMATDARRPG